MTITEINLKNKLENLDLDFPKSNPEKIHSIHPYPAKFIPEIPRTLIANLPIPKDTIIFDPFCGSGVTLVEAQRAGVESLGVDLNPIACLISNVKIQRLPSNFLDIVDDVVSKCQNYKGVINIPQIPNLDHWFKKEIQEGLAIILGEINKTQDKLMLEALRYCISSIIVRVSNQDSDTRYAAVENKYSKEDVFKLFKISAEKLQKSKNLNALEVKSQVINKSSLLLEKNDFPKKVGLLITSPPYPNAYEYWLYHKYRMWWLGYDPISVKKDEIGARAHYFKKNHQTVDDFINQLDILFKSLKEICAEDAYLCFIIGQSKIHGDIIENEKLIAIAGKENGFTHVTTLKRSIRSGRKSFNLSHARIKDEYVVILQK